MWICTAAWSLRPLNCSSFIFPTFGKRSVSHFRLEKCNEEALKKIYVMAAYVLLLVICCGSRAMFHLRLEIWPWWPELFWSWPALFKATGPLPLLILPPSTMWSTVGLVARVGLLNPCLHRDLISRNHTRLPGDSTHCPCKTHTLLLRHERWPLPVNRRFAFMVLTDR